MQTSDDNDELKPLDVLLDNLRLLQEHIREPHMVNSDGDEVDFERGQFHLVVGGDKLNRGFTVEGLVVTYMSRPIAKSGTVDSLEQRARFSEYKRDIFKWCQSF